MTLKRSLSLASRWVFKYLKFLIAAVPPFGCRSDSSRPLTDSQELQQCLQCEGFPALLRTHSNPVGDWPLQAHPCARGTSESLHVNAPAIAPSRRRHPAPAPGSCSRQLLHASPKAPTSGALSPASMQSSAPLSRNPLLSRNRATR
jgi:hypothetical protein